MKIEYKTLADIYNLKSSILLNITESIPEIHHEAYLNNIIVEVKTSEQLKCHSVAPLTKDSPNAIAIHLLNVLIYGEEKSVTYKGSADPTSLRAAAYRQSKKLGIKVSTQDTFGMTVITAERTDIKRITDALDRIQLGQSTALPLTFHTTKERLRSTIINYGERTGYKFKTRIVGDMIYVTKSLPKESFNSTGITPEHFKTWLTVIPFDVAVKPETEMTVNHMRVCATRHMGCCVTVHEDGSVTKRSLKKGIENGQSVIRINGQIVYARKHFDVPEINSILSIYGKTYEDL